MTTLLFRYEGEGEFRAASNYHARRADLTYVVHEVYPLQVEQQRSQATHNHFFAAIANAHANLPDDLLEVYPTPEHLRKKALVRKGYRHEREYVCESKTAAVELVKTIRPLDDYAIIEARENVVRIWTAKSQSKKAMPAGEFQRSKSDVLDYVADLIGVSPDELGKAA